MKPFLTASWSDLILANYAVDPGLLRPYLPTGIELDDEDGRHWISLVAFRFHETRVRGFRIPGHHDFVEVNLRFYVRRETPAGPRRGVVFVKEIVPRRAIALVARLGYGEPYETWRMERRWLGTTLAGEGAEKPRLRYEWSRRRIGAQAVEVTLGEELGIPPDESHAAFLLEHYWGYTGRGPERTDEYRVEHPRWALRDPEDACVDCDFGVVYGPDFALLTDRRPDSVIFALGSSVSVYKGATLV